MRCKDCKFWTRNKSSSDDNRFGDCFNDAFEYDYSAREIHSNDQFIYWDYESYSAGFTTGEMFGCIHFNPKEEKSCEKSIASSNGQ